MRWKWGALNRLEWQRLESKGGSSDEDSDEDDLGSNDDARSKANGPVTGGEAIDEMSSEVQLTKGPSHNENIGRPQWKWETQKRRIRRMAEDWRRFDVPIIQHTKRCTNGE